MLLSVFNGCEGFLKVTVPNELPYLISTIINIIKIAIPVLLIIFGMLDLGKAVTAGKEDEIKKGQQVFIKRLTAAVVVFLVVAIVQLLFSLLANANAENKGIMGCVSCLITDKASCYVGGVK